MPNADPIPLDSGIPRPPTEGRPSTSAWQPITPRGVAAFAVAPISRVLAVQFIVACLIAGAVCWFVAEAWLSTAKRAIRRLPESGGITNAFLVSPRMSTEPLARSRFIAFVLDLEGRTGAEVQSDVLVTFRRRDVRFCSLVGCATLRYDKAWEIPMSRVELEAAWGAWRSMFLSGVIVVTVAGLFASWLALALIAFPLIRLYAFFKDRQITLVGSWKLALASFLPGALITGGLIVLYGLEMIDLLRFLIGWSVHFFVGVGYLILAPLCLPKVPAAPAVNSNPFTAAPSEVPETPR
jgi:hypothetical protein